MKSLRVFFSDAALADIIDQFDWYADKAGHTLAKRWEKAVTSSVIQVARAPGTGSLCNFRAQQLRDTRRIAVAGFPKHLIFYQSREDRIVILRVVHGARDLESLFSEGRFAS